MSTAMIWPSGVRNCIDWPAMKPGGTVSDSCGIGGGDGGGGLGGGGDGDQPRVGGSIKK